MIVISLVLIEMINVKCLKCDCVNRYSLAMAEVGQELNSGNAVHVVFAVIPFEFFLNKISKYYCLHSKQKVIIRTESHGLFLSPPGSRCFHFLIVSILLNLHLSSKH